MLQNLQLNGSNQQQLELFGRSNVFSTKESHADAPVKETDASVHAPFAQQPSSSSDSPEFSVTLTQALEQMMDDMVTETEEAATGSVFDSAENDASLRNLSGDCYQKEWYSGNTGSDVNVSSFAQPDQQSGTVSNAISADPTDASTGSRCLSLNTTPTGGTSVDHGLSRPKQKRVLAATISSPGSVRSMRSNKSLKSTKSVDEFKAIPEFGQSSCAHEEVLEDILDQQQQTHDDFPDIISASTSTSLSGPSTVKTITDAMAWPSNHSNVLMKHLDKHSDAYTDLDNSSDSETEGGEVGSSLKRILHTFDSIPMSTSFSGIDAPSTGLCQQISELNTRCKQRKHIGKPLHINAIEWFGPSQQELLDHPCRPACLFSDITNFLSPYLRKIFPDLVKNGKLMLVFKPLVTDPNNESILMKLGLGVIDFFVSNVRK